MALGLGMLLWFNLAFGLQCNETIVDIHKYDHPPIVMEIEVHAENDWLDIYGIYSNEMDKIDEIYFVPLLDNYTIGASITLFNISLTFEHKCFHPVKPLGVYVNDFNGAYNKIEITFSSKR